MVLWGLHIGAVMNRAGFRDMEKPILVLVLQIRSFRFGLVFQGSRPRD